MWMLIRANALGGEAQPDQGTRTLAANPDTGERGDPWRWTVLLDESGSTPDVRADVDTDYIELERRQYRDGQTAVLDREKGRQMVIAVLRGEALVAAETGPWERWLWPGDVFVIEGEDPEMVRLSLTPGEALGSADSPGAGEAWVEVISLAPKKAHALRWVP